MISAAPQEVEEEIVSSRAPRPTLRVVCSRWLGRARSDIEAAPVTCLAYQDGLLDLKGPLIYPYEGTNREF